MCAPTSGHADAGFAVKYGELASIVSNWRYIAHLEFIDKSKVLPNLEIAQEPRPAP